MNGDSRTAPTRPPPGPWMPGLSALGCDGSVLPVLTFSPQHAVESDRLSDSSNVTMIRPFALKAGDAMIRGTHVLRNALAWASPPFWPFVHGSSCPSAQVSGVMNE